MVCAKFQANRCRPLGGDVKSRFFAFCDVAKKKSRRKWAWPIPRDSGAAPEQVDIRILNIGCTVWKIEAITWFTSAAAPPTGKFGKRLQNKILVARPDACAKYEKKLRTAKPPKRRSSANKKERIILTDTIGLSPPLRCRRLGPL